MTLFREFREILIPVVVNMVHNMQADSNPEDINSLLQKDAGIATRQFKGLSISLSTIVCV